jgi:hypothetical protein
MDFIRESSNELLRYRRHWFHRQAACRQDCWARPEATVYFLTRAIEQSPRLQDLYEYWGCDASRAIPIVGDLTQAELGVSKADIRKLKGKIEHFFHLAAIYDLKASAEDQQRANVDGTRNTVGWPRKSVPGHFPPGQFDCFRRTLRRTVS